VRVMAATRRLAAILAADVAGYSRLMGADEEGTHERLRRVPLLLHQQQRYQCARNYPAQKPFRIDPPTDAIDWGSVYRRLTPTASLVTELAHQLASASDLARGANLLTGPSTHLIQGVSSIPFLCRRLSETAWHQLG
jgi:hypothetical protein